MRFLMISKLIRGDSFVDVRLEYFQSKFLSSMIPEYGLEGYYKRLRGRFSMLCNPHILGGKPTSPLRKRQEKVGKATSDVEFSVHQSSDCIDILNYTVTRAYKVHIIDERDLRSV